DVLRGDPRRRKAWFGSAERYVTCAIGHDRMLGGLAYIDAQTMRDALPPRRAVAALEDLFLAGRPASAPSRMHVPIPGGTLLLMPSVGAFVGVKLVTVLPENHR